MTEQAKWERVVKALACNLNFADRGDCESCGYPCSKAHFISVQANLVADALALLKAQEPMAVHVTAEINYRKIGNCPNCGKPINSGDYPNYCGHCGQAVKWE